MKEDFDMTFTSVSTADTSTTPASVVIGGYQALGVAGNKFAVFSMLNKRVHLVGPSDLKEMNMKALFGAKWCEAQYLEFDAKKEMMVFNHRQLATDVMSDCQAAGPYSETTERRVGVWKSTDGQLVINGNELWRPDGTVLEHGIHDGRVYPASGDIGFNLNTPEATDEEVKKVLGALNSPQWLHPMGGELVLGFIGVAILAAVLPIRPHILMTGPAACGKSTVLQYVRWLLGTMVHGCSGAQTIPGYSQSLVGTAKAVAHDEFEADPARHGCRATFEVSRMSYSLQEGDHGIVRGTVTGKPRNYWFFSPFIAAGISPGKMEPADLTRWVVLETKGKPDGGRLTEAEARAIGPKLARRMVNRWALFQASEDVVRQCILNAGGDGRMADTVGTLLAMYWTMVSDQPATVEDAAFLVGMLGIEERIAVHQVSDELQCLEAMTSRVASFKVMEGYALVTRSLSIGQSIEMVCNDPTGQPDMVCRLAQLGLRVALSKGKWSVYVVNSPMHQELRKLFAGTKWASGGWSVILRRLPGGEESTQRLGAGLGPTKVTVFDVPQHLLPSNEADDMPLAA